MKTNYVTLHITGRIRSLKNVSLSIVTEGTGLEVAAINNRIFCSMLRIERFQSHDQLHPS